MRWARTKAKREADPRSKDQGDVSGDEYAMKPADSRDRWMQRDFYVGQSVAVDYNLRLINKPDKPEPLWGGRVIYVTPYSVGVQPDDKSKLPRDVLKERVF